MSIAHKKPLLQVRGRNRTARPKTFKSEAEAKAYATKRGIKSFEVKHLNNGISKKFKIVSK
jgi:hypothetical protein